MKPSTELFDFIQKMDASERGFFKKYAANQGGDKNYILVFEALCKMKTYDRDVLKQKLKGQAFVKDVHVTQNYLQKMIMKSLRLYRVKHDVDLQLRNLVINAKIYDEKGFYKRAQKALEKAKNLALTHHKYLIVLDILERQAIHSVARNVHDTLDATQKIYLELTDALQVLEEEYTFKRLNHQVLLCYRAEKRNAPYKYATLLSEISNHPLLNNGKIPQSFYSKYLRYNIRCIEARMYEDREIAHENYLKILKLWEDHKEIREANTRRYKVQISNFLGNAITAGIFNGVESHLDKLEELGGKKLKEKVETFQNVAYLKLLFYLNQSMLGEAKTFILNNSEKLNKYDAHLVASRAIVIYYNILIVFFLFEDYGAAPDWVNKILDHDKESPRQDIKSFARIIQFIIHYELENDKILDYLLKIASNRLRKEDRENDYQTPYENKWLQFFKSLINVKNDREKIALLQSFKNWLESQMDHSPQFMGIHELLFWLEARITGRSVRSIYSENLNKISQ